MEKIVIDPMWMITGLIAVIGASVGFYLVRLDNMVEHLRDEIIKMQKDIGKLQNADITCTQDQTILKMDMSHIRATLLKMVSHRFMRKKMKAQWKLDREETKKLGLTTKLQDGDL